MNTRAVVVAITLGALMVSLVAFPASAGGPPPRICPPPMCAPAMCPPPMCPPPMCPPPVCGPPPCPPPVCGPPPCPPPCPPRYCEEFPCLKLIKGACKLCIGLAALPFQVCGSLMNQMDCADDCAPYTRLVTAPVPCPMPPMCGPGPMPVMCPAIGPRGPKGYGNRAPRRMAPLARSGEPVEKRLMATRGESPLGVFW